jgi:hypothetical protein
MALTSGAASAYHNRAVFSVATESVSRTHCIASCVRHRPPRPAACTNNTRTDGSHLCASYSPPRQVSALVRCRGGVCSPLHALHVRRRRREEEERTRSNRALGALSHLFFLLASSARQHGVDCAVPCTVDGARISARSQPVRSAAQIRHERFARSQSG